MISTVEIIFKIRGAKMANKKQFFNGITREMKLYFVGILIFIGGVILPFDAWIKQGIFTGALLFSGYHVILEGIEDTIEQSKIKRRFRPNTHILMSLAAFGAVILGDAAEAALLIFIFAGAHFLEEYVEEKSQREITALLKLNPTQARRITSNGEIEIVDVNQLNIADHLQVLNGGQIPTDGIIIEGTTQIDESSINGEAMPREKAKGDEVFGATINGTGVFIMRVTKASHDTVFAKIIQLVEASQSHLSPTASRIKKYEPIYVQLILLVFIGVLFVGPLLFQWSFQETIDKGLTFMVSASPCALAVSAIPATLAGISNLAKQGILFKGGNFLSQLAHLKAIAFDKTGTLTSGKPQVVHVHFEQTLMPESSVIALIVTMEKQANHPLATAIIDHFDQKTKAIELEVENRIGLGLVAHYQGKWIQIGQSGLFDQIDARWLEEKNVEEKKGRTVVFVGIEAQIIGLISIQDVPQKSAKAAIQYFKSVNVETVMITGDGQLTGDAIGRELEINRVIAHVLPEEKAHVISQLQETRGLTAMLGDGTNDAPALVTADIGIAMGNGTDVAIETADVVLMQNNLEKLITAHKTSKQLGLTISENIIFSLLVVLILVGFTFFGHLSVLTGVMLHEGSTLLVLLNGLRLLSRRKSKNQGHLGMKNI